MELKHAGAPAGGELTATADPAQAFGDQWQAGLAVGLIAQLVLLAALARSVGLSSGGWIAGVTCGAIIDVALGYGLFRYRAERLAPADWVTLARATLAVGVAALVADSFGGRTAVPMLVSLTVVALVLDAVDGWVARRTRTTPIVGAQFDAEVDAFLILVLSVYVARSAGAWVLTIGAARYAFLVARWPLPWMRAVLPARYWRKVVAATQGVVLAIGAAGVLPPEVTRTVVLAALVLLAESFGRDGWWLWSNRGGVRGTRGAHVPPVGGRRRARQGIAAALTIMAALIVWGTLVAPDQPSHLTLGGFFRIPVEGLIFIAMAAVLPRTPRRILAVGFGLFWRWWSS